MYAVIKTGGKQYKVASGDKLKIEKLSGEAGDEVTFDEVLMVKNEDSVSVGRPLVENASVSAKILRQDKHSKIIVFHKKRRKTFSKKTGHRQPFTEIEITGINA